MNKLSSGIKKLNSLDFTKEQLINFMLHIAIIVVPLIIFDFRMLGIDEEDSKGHSQYVEGKVFGMFVIGFILAILSIMSLRKINKENIVAIAFLLSIFVSSICSPYINVAFIGNQHRGEGFIMIFIYIIMFILASQYFKPGKITIRIVFISSIIVNAIAVLQFFGFDFIAFILGFEQGESHKALGTLGNRNFFGTYTLIFLILSMAIYIFKAKKEYLVYACINFIGVLTSLTRSCWGSFIIVCIIGIIFILKRRNCLKRVGIIVISFIVIFASIDYLSDNKITGRGSVENIVSDGKLVDSANNRNEIFNMCKNAFIDKPLLGTGPDTLELRLQNDYPDDFWKYSLTVGNTVDKAHNEFLEYAVNDGICTLIIYIILVIMVISKLIKNINDDINKVLLITILAYLIQAILNISTVGVAQIFWILLGYAVCRNNKTKEEEVR